MKKIALLLIVPLLLGSCLKNDEEKFSDSSADRMEARIAEARKILSEAPNGWVMEYYPESDRIYGGYTIFVKFTADEVTAACELFKSDVRSTSLYSIKADNGPVLRFDTYNDVLHFFSDAKLGQSQIGSLDGGLEGDLEFTVMEARPDYVRLKGKKTNNMMTLTPLAADADWTEEMKKYQAAASDMELLEGFSFDTGDVSIPMTTDAQVNNFTSRVFTITLPKDPQNPDGPKDVISAPFVYTKTGIKFYSPLKLSGKSTSEMTYTEGYYFADNTDPSIKIMTPIPAHSDIKFTTTIPTAKIGYVSAEISVVPSIKDEYYRVVVYNKSENADIIDKRIIKADLAQLNEYTEDFPVETLMKNFLKKGDLTFTQNRLEYNSDYIVGVYGCKKSEDGRSIVPTTELFKQEIKTLGVPANATDDYKAWLGKWTVVSTSGEKTGKPITLEVTIGIRVPNTSYTIKGWSITYNRDLAARASTGVFSAKKLLMNNDELIYTYTDGETINYIGRSKRIQSTGTTYGGVGGTYPALTLALNSDQKTASVTQYAGGLGGGGTFTVMTMDFFRYTADGGSYYYWNWPSTPAGVVAQDYPFGPFTMTKQAVAAAPKYRTDNSEKQFSPVPSDEAIDFEMERLRADNATATTPIFYAE